MARATPSRAQTRHDERMIRVLRVKGDEQAAVRSYFEATGRRKDEFIGKKASFSILK